ncbi:hypothetical protein [Paracidovorax anthurii]|uniref:Uncharacterized protein n=1 Tax=Paracidovorax anthurii TaxID=78229 RepID=A0A328YJ76_9BURK|nr:hypothetical protein [Paracidovorax anthurii]RAR74019.1 hypothetical protein AX018_106814 [Paracidovorax anthurii]
MQKPLDSIALAIATLVQLGGSVGAIAALAWWAASLAAGSVLGGILLFLLGALFVVPIVAWGLPAVSLAAGLLAAVIAQGLRLIQARSRA